MGCRKSAEKSAALRELHEGAPPTFERLAQAAGRGAAGLAHQAAREGWGRRLGKIGAGERLARLSALGDWIIDRLEAVRRHADADAQPIDKAEVEAVAALMRTVEKVGEVAAALDGSQESQARRDARKAGVLERIDRRIVELARAFAAQLAADGGRAE